MNKKLSDEIVMQLCTLSIFIGISYFLVSVLDYLFLHTGFFTNWKDVFTTALILIYLGIEKKFLIKFDDVKINNIELKLFSNLKKVFFLLMVISIFVYFITITGNQLFDGRIIYDGLIATFISSSLGFIFSLVGMMVYKKYLKVTDWIYISNEIRIISATLGIPFILIKEMIF